MVKKNANQSPCVKCRRCKDPANCEQKTFTTWYEWWIGRWNHIRNIWLLAERQGGKR